ncbi:pam-1 [Pristionchus pacificus]|nr:pam-1 [Pristionchus pacificus]
MLVGVARVSLLVGRRVLGSLVVETRLSHSTDRRLAAMACSNGNAPKTAYERLSSSIKPSHYRLQLTPCIKTFSLHGKVEIDVNIEKETGEIKLHSDGLAINKVDIKTTAQNFSDVRTDLGKEMITLTPTSPIAVGKATVSIEFTGELRTNMKGFYRSMYKGEDGVEKVLASTQFESTFARMAFPCFDEPAMKAKFDVELVVDKTLTALSNMPVISETPNGDALKSVRFGTTPIMSTYLLAFAVGELEYIETTTTGGTIVRVYTTAGKKAQGEFSLVLAKRALEWYGEWFAIPYALPKCDLIAVPDFHMGAMENWGLVTFREVALLFDPVKTSNRQKSYIALVVAHELAHLWFGDLVTMYWWTDLWLKEGFASFMEYLFVGHNYDEFKIWLRFARDEITSGMNLDALRNSHPIEVQIDNPNELDEIYDSITYAKSNCVNRMLCEYLGEETFQNGLRIYLARHSYGNATTVDLWNAHSEASGQDIAKMMSGWTQQMGFPLITVKEVKREAGSRVLSLSQKRFIVDGSNDEKDSKWMVPITTLVGPSGKRGTKAILSEETGTITVAVEGDEYVKLNASTGGFYRVAYDAPMFDSLVKAFHTLPPIDRFGFASDCFALMVSGAYSASQFLSLVAICSSESEYAVWGALDDGLNELSVVLSHSDAALKKRLDAFVIKAMVPVLEKLGWEPAAGEDMHRGQLRSLVINRLARSGHEDTIQAALSLFSSKKADLNSDIRSTVFGIAARSGTAEHFAELKKIYETNGFSEVERNAATAMAQTSDVSQRDNYFRYAFKEDKVRSQDLAFVVAASSTTRDGQEYAWEFFKTEQPLLLKKLGGTQDSLYQRAFKYIAEGFCSEAKAKEVESFFCSCPSFTPESVAALDRPIKQVTETIRVNERLLSSNAKSIDEFLSAKGY